MTCADCGQFAPKGQKYCGTKGCKVTEAKKRSGGKVESKKGDRSDAYDQATGTGKIKVAIDPKAKK